MNPDERVVLVEFDPDGRPFAVTTRHPLGGCSYYSFEWCQRDECLYWHESGSGRDIPLNMLVDKGTWRFWLAPGEVAFTSHWSQKLRRSFRRRVPERHPSRMAEESECVKVDPVSGCPRCFAASMSDVIYCRRCDDHLPTDWVGDEICPHIWWCDECSDFIYPGERCSHWRARRRVATRRSGGSYRSHS